MLKIFEEFWWLGIFSIATFVLTILILPIVIVRLPADYFAVHKADGFISRQNRRWRFSLLFLKNLAGVILLVMGFLMLFIPGQGVLTILAGLSVMNFPGKRKLEIRIVSNKKVFHSLNWIRSKGKKEHFHNPVKISKSYHPRKSPPAP
ncbi:MAG: hypothetical protein JEY91_14785 [Spirochaetaceae bacterium]|nr:hypothetical protein [Spirochaetaceae bacterium]